MRKIASVPYSLIQRGRESTSIPPPGTGKAGRMDPRGSKRRWLIALHVRWEKGNLPREFGKITASLPTIRKSRPRSTSGATPWSGRKNAPTTDGWAMIANPDRSDSRRTASKPTKSGLTRTPLHPSDRTNSARSSRSVAPVMLGRYRVAPPVRSFAVEPASWQRDTRSSKGAGG